MMLAIQCCILWLQIDQEKKQFSVSLKQSVTGNQSAAYAASLFRALETASVYK